MYESSMPKERENMRILDSGRRDKWVCMLATQYYF